MNDDEYAEPSTSDAMAPFYPTDEWTRCDCCDWEGPESQTEDGRCKECAESEED